MFVLIREKRTETAILGRLFLGGVVIAYTLENAAKAIPAGLYSIENSKSPKFKRELPLFAGFIGLSGLFHIVSSCLCIRNI